MCRFEEQGLRDWPWYTQYPGGSQQPKNSASELAEEWDVVEGERTEAGEHTLCPRTCMVFEYIESLELIGNYAFRASIFRK